jgi:SAM-dependent methyltransferase
MRHLDHFPSHAFDLVYHAYSINFVPDVRPVLAEVARVLRPGGQYRIEWANPFVQTIESEQDWTGEGYLLRFAYVDGRELTDLYPNWTHLQEDGTLRLLPSPREFVHSLSTMINSLAHQGFVITHCREATGDRPEAEPGTWDHFLRVAPPYLTLWARFLPAVLGPGTHPPVI